MLIIVVDGSNRKAYELAPNGKIIAIMIGWPNSFPDYLEKFTLQFWMKLKENKIEDDFPYIWVSNPKHSAALR